MARSTSAGVASGNELTTWPWAGLRRSKRCLSVDSVHVPSMYMRPLKASCAGALSFVKSAVAAGIAVSYVMSLTLVLRRAPFAETGHAFAGVVRRCGQRARHGFQSCAGPESRGGVDQLLGQLHGDGRECRDLFSDRDGGRNRLFRRGDFVDQADAVRAL